MIGDYGLLSFESSDLISPISISLGSSLVRDCGGRLSGPDADTERGERQAVRPKRGVRSRYTATLGRDTGNSGDHLQFCMRGEMLESLGAQTEPRIRDGVLLGGWLGVNIEGGILRYGSAGF